MRASCPGPTRRASSPAWTAPRPSAARPGRSYPRSPRLAPSRPDAGAPATGSPDTRPPGRPSDAAARPRRSMYRTRLSAPAAAAGRQVLAGPRRRRAGRRRAPAASASRSRQVDRDDREVPVRREDLETVLLLASKRVLVGKEPPELGFRERLVRRGGVLPHDGDAIVPAAVFGGVKPRCFRGDLLRVSQLDL